MESPTSVNEGLGRSTALPPGDKCLVDKLRKRARGIVDSLKGTPQSEGRGSSGVYLRGRQQQTSEFDNEDHLNAGVKVLPEVRGRVLVNPPARFDWQLTIVCDPNARFTWADRRRRKQVFCHLSGADPVHVCAIKNKRPIPQSC